MGLVAIMPHDPFVRFFKTVNDYFRAGHLELDGGTYQDLAERLGLIVPTVYDPVVHGEVDDVSAGDEIYILSTETVQRIHDET